MSWAASGDSARRAGLRADGRGCGLVVGFACGEFAEQVGYAAGRFLGHEVADVDAVVDQVRRPRAPQGGRVEAECRAPVLLDDGHGHRQAAPGGTVGLVVLDVDARRGPVVGHDVGHRLPRGPQVLRANLARDCFGILTPDIEELAEEGVSTTARVIGNFDVPAIWPHSDDPVTAARIAAAAERTLTALTAQSAVLDQLGEAHERPLVSVFTAWYRAMRAAMAAPDAPGAEEGYRQAAKLLDGSGMQGVERGLLPLAQLCLRVWRHRPTDLPEDTHWGPYHAWARPWLLLARDSRGEAAQALRSCAVPARGLLSEALWCLTARAAVALGDHALAGQAHKALEPAAGEIAGAASGMLTAGPVSDYLAETERPY